MKCPRCGSVWRSLCGSVWINHGLLDPVAPDFSHWSPSSLEEEIGQEAAWLPCVPSSFVFSALLCCLLLYQLIYLIGENLANTLLIPISHIWYVEVGIFNHWLVISSTVSWVPGENNFTPWSLSILICKNEEITVLGLICRLMKLIYL